MSCYAGKRAMEHLLDLLEVTAARRPGMLDRICGDDGKLRRELESLLALEDLTEEFLREPAVRLDDPVLEPDSRLGPYRIIELLGRGGMAAVYRAEREDDFKKQVAIKLSRGDALGDETFRRFDTERRIQARLDHPGIARLLDSGTTAEGRPYLVMELVNGTSIRQHCSSRALTVRQRLELLLEVFSAVAYAHRNLVIHRDLKPDNILVTREGAPVLIDLGIAKLLDPDESSYTRPGHRPMTPCYGSPEQISQAAVDTASDVYALGVLLYQLLTGQLPCAFGGCAFKAVFPQACGDLGRPAAPEAGLRPELDRDLKTIVLKALSKEPAERYGSVEVFAQDIRRYLDGLPVHARLGTWVYRTRCFARRHRWGVATVLLLFALTGVSTRLWHQAEWARAEAVQADIRATRVSALLRGHCQTADAQGRTLTAKELLDRGRTRLFTGLEDHPEAEAELAVTLAHAYRNLGFHEEALHLLNRAGRARGRQTGSEPASESAGQGR